MDAQGEPRVRGEGARLRFDRPLKITVTRQGRVKTVALAGSVQLAEAEELAAELPALVEAAAPFVIVDLAELEFISSLGLSAMVKAHKAARELGGNLVLVHPQPPIAKLLKLTRMDELLAIMPSLQAAQAALPPDALAGTAPA